jgi:hypothetical protein
MHLMARTSIPWLAPLLVGVALAATTTVAQASEPHWYTCESAVGGTFAAGCTSSGSGFKKVAVGASPGIKVTMVGGLRFTELGEPFVECKVLPGSEGKIWNPGGTSGAAGEGTITAFKMSCTPSTACSAAEMTALALPWKTTLLTGPPIKDRIKGVEIEEKCGGAFANEFLGRFNPEFINGKPSWAKFTAGGNNITDMRSNTVEVTGEVNFEGPGGEVVLATNP